MTKHERMVKELNEVLIEHGVTICSDDPMVEIIVEIPVKGKKTVSSHEFLGVNPDKLEKSD